MATHRRLGTLARHFRFIHPQINHANSSKALIPPFFNPTVLKNPNPNPSSFSHLRQIGFMNSLRSFSTRHFSSSSGEEDGGEEEDEDDEDEDEEVCNGSVTKYRVSGKTEEEKISEAADIGYKVVGPLDPSEKLFKPYEPAFAVVQIGSHQFKVSNGDSIFTERLKFCEVNDKLILNKVLMLGSRAETIIGRPVLPQAAVHAVVEEHALDAKVIIFKKKRRKNYRRTKGHRQELTKLRITDIQGIEKSEPVAVAA